MRFYTDQLRSSTVDVYACHYLLKRHYLLSKLDFHIKLTTFCNLIFKFNEMLKLDFRSKYLNLLGCIASYIPPRLTAYTSMCEVCVCVYKMCYFCPLVFNTLTSIMFNTRGVCVCVFQFSNTHIQKHSNHYYHK